MSHIPSQNVRLSNGKMCLGCWALDRLKHTVSLIHAHTLTHTSFCSRGCIVQTRTLHVHISASPCLLQNLDIKPTYARISSHTHSYVRPCTHSADERVIAHVIAHTLIVPCKHVHVNMCHAHARMQSVELEHHPWYHEQACTCSLSAR
jgi:hypothetical protein